MAGYARPTKPCTAPSWWGCFVCLCFASQMPSEREFFVPYRNRLRCKAVNGGREGEIDDMEGRRQGRGEENHHFQVILGSQL